MVRDFILNNVERHPASIALLTSKEFHLSRAAINGYLQRLIKDGLLAAEGNTRARRYSLTKIVDIKFKLKLYADLAEDVIWRYKIAPFIKNIPQNVLDICQYGFTEMLNNAVDHSVSPDAGIIFQQSAREIIMVISDSGVGIFEKIQKELGLPDPRTALLELSKGKLTTYSARHSGEGIFFTSRMFDRFNILSGHLFYDRLRGDDDEWLFESGEERHYKKGTLVYMAISTRATHTTRQIFAKYEGDGTRFRKTHVPVLLAKYPGEQLVSRSQARRVLSRFDAFSEVILDFQGVTTIGQAFADEIFRVFPLDHPDIEVKAMNTTPEVQTEIDAARYLHATQRS